MGWLVALLARSGLPQRHARVIAIGVLVATLMLALWLALAIRDRRVIARHEAGAAVAQARADRAADAQAATRRRSDDARLEAEADALEKVTDNAIDDPRGARRAYYECLRVQQQARRAGHLTPAC
ncbi:MULTISPECIES: hypothetical protein [unclassified Sphingobium]|uniref:hypothetical protein n=1 Tax=unclassified Sphingobium TaxID=2611147 RepID=UPI0035A6F088